MYSRLYKKQKVGQMLPASHSTQEDSPRSLKLPNSLVMRVMEESGAER